MFVSSGSVGPKSRPKGVDDGYPVNIPELFLLCYQLSDADQRKSALLRITRFNPGVNRENTNPEKSGGSDRTWFPEKSDQGMIEITVPQTNTGGLGE